MDKEEKEFNYHLLELDKIEDDEIREACKENLHNSIKQLMETIKIAEECGL